MAEANTDHTICEAKVQTFRIIREEGSILNKLSVDTQLVIEKNKHKITPHLSRISAVFFFSQIIIFFVVISVGSLVQNCRLHWKLATFEAFETYYFELQCICRVVLQSTCHIISMV